MGLTPDRHSRRQLLKGAIGGAAGLVLGAPLRAWASRLQAAPTGDGILRLSDDLFVVRMPGEANVVAQTTGGGVVLVDGGSARGSDALLKAVAALPGGGPVQ